MAAITGSNLMMQLMTSSARELAPPEGIVRHPLFPCLFRSLMALRGHDLSQDGAEAAVRVTCLSITASGAGRGSGALPSGPALTPPQLALCDVFVKKHLRVAQARLRAFRGAEEEYEANVQLTAQRASAPVATGLSDAAGNAHAIINTSKAAGASKLKTVANTRQHSGGAVSLKTAPAAAATAGMIPKQLAGAKRKGRPSRGRTSRRGDSDCSDSYGSGDESGDYAPAAAVPLKPAFHVTGRKPPPVTQKGKQMPPDVTNVLMKWFLDNLVNPYPSKAEKENLMATTGLDNTQLRNWLTNQRKRHWRPVLNGRAPRSELELVLKASSDAMAEDDSSS